MVEPDVVVLTYNPSILKAGFPGQPKLHSKTVSQKTKLVEYVHSVLL
jgi:hypothetical protein